MEIKENIFPSVFLLPLFFCEFEFLFSMLTCGI